MSEWSLSAVQDVVASAVPERDMLVWGQVRRSYAEVRRRTAGLARFLAEHGLGARRERSHLARWECGQSPVALVSTTAANTSSRCWRATEREPYPSTSITTTRPASCAHCWTWSAARRSSTSAGSVPSLPTPSSGWNPLLIDVEDGSDVPPLPGSTRYESAVDRPDGGRAAQPSPDDLYMVCTGGTTGLPKAVLWRQADIFVAGMGGSETSTEKSLAEGAASGVHTWFPAPPLMHAAAQWTAFVGMQHGRERRPPGRLDSLRCPHHPRP